MKYTSEAGTQAGPQATHVFTTATSHAYFTFNAGNELTVPASYPLPCFSRQALRRRCRHMINQSGLDPNNARGFGSMQYGQQGAAGFPLVGELQAALSPASVAELILVERQHSALCLA